MQSILSLAPRCPRGSLVPYQSKEHQFCGALLTERTVRGMLSGRANIPKQSAINTTISFTHYNADNITVTLPAVD